MKKSSIVEVVMWTPSKGHSLQEAKEASLKLNAFVQEQPGFLQRQTAFSEDGQLIDLVFWTDLSSAQKASEKAMQTPSLEPAFATMDQKSMFFKHFELFNQIP